MPSKDLGPNHHCNILVERRESRIERDELPLASSRELREPRIRHLPMPLKVLVVDLTVGKAIVPEHVTWKRLDLLESSPRAFCAAIEGGRHEYAK